MTQLLSAAQLHNNVEAKLREATAPMTLKDFTDMSEYAGVADYKIKHAIDSLYNKGKLIKLPVVVPGQRNRVGYQWSNGNVATPKTPKDTKPSKVVKLPVPTEPADDLKIRVNDDKSITVITSKMRITIEIPN